MGSPCPRSGTASWRGRSCRPRRVSGPRSLDMKFAHPLGIAAGFDKNAEAVRGLFRLGFSFVEIGTVTPRPQAGNPRPRLFRLADQQALINRLGFNNQGLEAVCARLAKPGPRPGPLGANIGANRDSADPIRDYVACLRGLYPLVDYVTVNVSSPNTPGLRDLQRRDRLDALLGALLEARGALAGSGKPKPLLLKIAPDLAPDDEAAIAEVVLARGIDGLIISNTTVARPELLTGRHHRESGGLSGAPLFRPATDQLKPLFSADRGPAAADRRRRHRERRRCLRQDPRGRLGAAALHRLCLPGPKADPAAARRTRPAAGRGRLLRDRRCDRRRPARGAQLRRSSGATSRPPTASRNRRRLGSGRGSARSDRRSDDMLSSGGRSSTSLRPVNAASNQGRGRFSIAMVSHLRFNLFAGVNASSGNR